MPRSRASSEQAELMIPVPPTNKTRMWTGVREPFADVIPWNGRWARVATETTDFSFCGKGSAPRAAMRCCASMPLAPIVIQAEQGALGNEFATADDGQETQYVTITGTMGGGAPALESRVISFEVAFPAPGSYELYLRAFVGPGGANDDSFFYGNGFG